MCAALPELPDAVRQRKGLIVEDSPFQRELLGALLREFGIADVQQVADGDAALALLRECRDELPLLLIDLEMPVMNGIELLQRLIEEHILAEVLIISGREEALISTVEGMLQAADMPLLGSLQKPIVGQDLHRLLSTAGERRAGSRRRVLSRRSPDEAELDVAIERGFIHPFYQPKVHLQSGRVTGYEVLARWVEPDGELIHPADFIPLATGCGLLGKLTFSLVEQVLQDLLGLTDDSISMALNVDISLLADRHFADELIHRVAAAGCQPSQLVLEVTESALMNDPMLTLASVGRLRLAGFGLSIDDYGTGFSTLRQLSRLPFTELKIDHAFIREAHKNQRARAILCSAIEMGHKLGLPCVAEGIEHPEDLLLLESLDCHSGQGYFFSRPMPGEQLAGWHQRHAGRTSLAQWIDG
ncbi:EAL domain-containing response regulator [Pseudomonas sp. B392_1p]|jgi:EAL domain-containing protein (putative c-di-GMP-specific phosphodiesterase class I)/FixJ family two-component response regulator|uniref:EAL domain-containing response regulator n=1 Tax=Pseudomonas sp. B392_1p TaxID=3457507 RepID=UPI003FD38527